MLAVLTPIQHKEPQDMGDSTTILFGLPGVRVQSVVRVGPGRIVHLVTDDPTAAACPVCGVLSTSVRQRRTTRPRDIAYGLEPLAAQWHKAQFACKEKACPRVAFTEAVAQSAVGSGRTSRTGWNGSTPGAPAPPLTRAKSSASPRR
jgi:transposase